MKAIHVPLVRSSLAFFEPSGPALIAWAVRRLGDTAPGLRAMLPDDTTAHHAAWFKTLRQVVRHCDRFSVLQTPLGEIGGRPAVRRFDAAHHAAMRDALLEAMREFAGEDWTPEHDTAWTLLLGAVSGAILAGGFEARRAA